MSPDYQHDGLRHAWVHPETGTTIACEDMPLELAPQIQPQSMIRPDAIR
ncbi:hypothetical protein ACEYYH_10530 [Microbacterium trichothecenolyticum]